MVLSIRLLQPLGATAVVRASLRLFHVPFAFLSIGSSMVPPGDSAAMGVAAVA
jgi:hypothetical protein